MAKLDDIKRHVFFEFLNLAGRAFIIVNCSRNVILGKRGFTEEEKKNGIILVFNSRMNFIWDERGISATLVFGNTPQKCFIPPGDIMAIYSPELDAQFIAGQPADGISIEEEPAAGKEMFAGEKLNKVIEVDFKKKRKKDE